MAGDWPRRLTRRQFVAAVGLATAAAAITPTAHAATLPPAAAKPIPVRLGRLQHAGSAFLVGEASGVIVPGLGGTTGWLTPARAGGTYTSATLPLEFPATHVGMHWTSAGNLPGITTEVRLSRDGQRWWDWRTLAIESHGRADRPDEHFTALLAAGGAQWLQYRLTFGSAEGAGLSHVGVAYLNAGASPAASGAQRFAGPSAFLDRVITREQWGADESIRFKEGVDQWPRAFVSPKFVAVHHTATENEYADPAAEVRAIYTYHTQVQGFGDIGYHLLIDNRGQVYEGRRGRELAPDAPADREIVSPGVVGGHVQGYNYGSLGIALLGNFVQEEPTPAALAALVEALAFTTDRHGLDPEARTDFLRVRGPSGANTLWRDDLAVIAGHRDCLETECPGDYLYTRLPELRRTVAARLGAVGPSARIVDAPARRDLWPTDARASWASLGGATEFSTRLEGFALPDVPDIITPLSGYTPDERELWSDWSRGTETSLPLDLSASGSFTLLIRARDARGREGRLVERLPLFVGRHVLVDNADLTRTERTGAWRPAREVLGFNGRDYEQTDPEAPFSTFTWRLTAPEPGRYRVLVCWAAGDIRASSARYSIHVAGAETGSARVDQRERGATWVEIGRVTLAAGAECAVTLNNQADNVVAADAARLVYAGP